MQFKIQVISFLKLLALLLFDMQFVSFTRTYAVTRWILPGLAVGFAFVWALGVSTVQFNTDGAMRISFLVLTLVQGAAILAFRAGSDRHVRHLISNSLKAFFVDVSSKKADHDGAFQSNFHVYILEPRKIEKRSTQPQHSRNGLISLVEPY
jgi:hypothetical protein